MIGDRLGDSKWKVDGMGNWEWKGLGRGEEEGRQVYRELRV